MHISKQDLQNTECKRRLSIVNNLSGVKSAFLIGTANTAGQENLAIFNSVVHIGSDPARLGFIIRPVEGFPRHTYRNILETKTYTLNMVPIQMIEKAHYTSAKFDVTENEFDACGFVPEYRGASSAPFVKESPLKLAMTYESSIDIPMNDTKLIIGQVEDIYLADAAAIDDMGNIDLDILQVAVVEGLNTYYGIEKKGWFPYARKENWKK